MIEVGKKCQTRDGRAVRILCVNNAGDLSVVGVFADGEVNRWHADGTFCAEYPLTGHRDLIPVPTKHEGWVAISNEGWVCGQYAGDRLKAGGLIDRKMAEYIAHVTWED